MRDYGQETSSTSIMNIALDVHMTLTGALDRGIDVKSKQEGDVELLREKLALWRPSICKGSKAFDTAVKQILVEVLREHDELWEG